MDVDRKNGSRRSLPIIFFLAFGLRLINVFLSDNRSMGTWSDQGGGIALNMLAGKGYIYSYEICHDFRSFRMPAFPLTLFAIWSVIGYNLLATKFIMAVVSALTCVLISLIGLELFSPGVAILAGLMAACFPNFIYWTGTAGPDTLTLFFAVGGVLFLCRKRTGADYVLAGVLLGLLSLTRPVYLPYSVTMAAYVFWAERGRGPVKFALLFSLSVAVVIAPWVVRNWSVHRAFLVTSTEGGMTFLECNNPKAFHERAGDWVAGYAGTLPEIRRAAPSLSEVQLDKLMYRKGLKFIRREPLMYAKSFLNRVWFLWRPVPRQGFSGKQALVMGATWLPILVLGIYGAYRDLRWGRGVNVPILFLVVWTTLAAGLIRTGIRYRAPIEPFVIVYAAAGLEALWRRRVGWPAPAAAPARHAQDLLA